MTGSVQWEVPVCHVGVAEVVGVATGWKNTHWWMRRREAWPMGGHVGKWAWPRKQSAHWWLRLKGGVSAGWAWPIGSRGCRGGVAKGVGVATRGERSLVGGSREGGVA